ncbi:STAS/SEC14 domain-containing protein [Shewanella hafniensis]|uniref:STAS/SEC14 domain-containing protein n=1 Tax=Shewanella hafniensis TaxID=365590 RepID=UPI001BBBA958|nr:STAS/SEC14 domain-containing protein [Shewanella hafniensis]MCL1136213.1 STAS/SEC14 domain-containing protein [Shewanella hafniensis]GIU32266.1 STAS/SEC14 domain-containing protein [Shewanella hafniensis]
MALLKHGITIGIERYGDDDFFVAFKAIGTLTHQDYEMMVPVLESALAGVKDPDIFALVDVTELDGLELQAAWDDLKLGVKHIRHFEKIAIVGKTTLQEVLAKLANWFTPAEVRFFVDNGDAVAWLRD